MTHSIGKHLKRNEYMHESVSQHTNQELLVPEYISDDNIFVSASVSASEQR